MARWAIQHQRQSFGLFLADSPGNPAGGTKVRPDLVPRSGCIYPPERRKLASVYIA